MWKTFHSAEWEQWSEFRGESHTRKVKVDEDDAIDIAETAAASSSSSTSAADELHKPKRRRERGGSIEII